MFRSLKSESTSLILLGVLAIIVGIIAVAWPGVTILALVILFAVYAFVDAGLQAARAFSSGSAGPVFGHLLLGLIDLAAGVIALVWPGPTAFVVVLVVAYGSADMPAVKRPQPGRPGADPAPDCLPSPSPSARNGPCAWSWSDGVAVFGGAQLRLDEGAWVTPRPLTGQGPLGRLADDQKLSAICL